MLSWQLFLGTLLRERCQCFVEDHSYEITLYSLKFVNYTFTTTVISDISDIEGFPSVVRNICNLTLFNSKFGNYTLTMTSIFEFQIYNDQEVL